MRVVNDYGEIQIMDISESITITSDVKITDERYEWVLKNPSTGEEYLLDGNSVQIEGDIGNLILMKTVVVPVEYNLSQPYPNPFNPTTTIQFSLPQSEMVSMKVYDLNGRLIETLLNDFYDMGKHTITWDGSSQSSGMYFVRLESGEYIQTRKVVLVQ